jgi:hypothetical protein
MPIVIIFVIVNALLIVFRTTFDRWGVDRDAMIIGNVLLFAITLLSYWIGIRGLRSPNTHAFVRGVYASMMIKLFLCAIAAFIYVSIYRESVNKPALFGTMGLYLVYSFLEVSILMKMLKGNANG